MGGTGKRSNRALEQLRPKAYWRAQKELDRAKKLQAQVSPGSKRRLETYVALRKQILEWLQKMEKSSDE